MLIHYSQSSMDTSANLEVVYIPCNALPICPKTISLIDVNLEDINKGECNDFEKKLGHIPDIRSHQNPDTFQLDAPLHPLPLK